MVFPIKAILSAIPKSVWAIVSMVFIILALSYKLLYKNTELVRLQTEIKTLSNLNTVDTVRITTVRLDTVTIVQKEITTVIDSVRLSSDTLIVKPFEDFYIKGYLRYTWRNHYLTSELSYKPKFPLYITKSVLDERTVTKRVNIPIQRDRKSTLKFGGGIAHYEGVMPLASVGYGNRRIIGGYSKDRWLLGLLVDF